MFGGSAGALLQEGWSSSNISNTGKISAVFIAEKYNLFSALYNPGALFLSLEVKYRV
jgi:hypothetical protein